jgi:MFS family permease
MDDNNKSPEESRYIGAASAIIIASILPTITITPLLPRMQAHFSSVPQVDVLVQLIYALPALLSMLSAPFIGQISDRIGRQHIVLISCILTTLLGIAPYFLESIWMIIWSRAFLGIFQGTLIVCTSTLIADYFVERRREAVLSLKFGIVGVANIVLLIGIGYASVSDWRNGFLLYLFGVIATLLVAFYIKTPPHTQRAGGQVKLPLNWRYLFFPYLGSFLGATSFTMLFSQLPFLLQARDISSSPAFAGTLTSVTSAGMLISAFLYSSLIRKVSAVNIWVATFGLVAVGFATTSMSPQLAGIVIGGFLSGLGTGFVMPNSLNMVLGNVPPPARGRATGIQSTCFFLGIFAGPMIGIALSRILGGPMAALGVWGLIAAGAAVFYITASRVLATGSTDQPFR